MENRRDGTFADARITINAFFRVDVDHFRIFMETVAWANHKAGFVFATSARFSHYHRHGEFLRFELRDLEAVCSGDEKLDEKADMPEPENLKIDLHDQSGVELVKLWASGNQDAAQILVARYQIRLMAMISARLSAQYRHRIATEDVVQSALVSFFRTARHQTERSVIPTSTKSVWDLLALFARRKLSRAIERESASKRGGHWKRYSLEQFEHSFPVSPGSQELEELLIDLRSQLDDSQSQLLELLLQNATQKEIAQQCAVDERTIRRRLMALRNLIAEQWAGEFSFPTKELRFSPTISLPQITYGQFVLGKLVGRGALGKVYRARWQPHGQLMAVKFMHRDLWKQPESQDSFLREIDLASKIHHPGIIRYLGWGRSPHGGPYLLSEYIDGSALTKCSIADAPTRWKRFIDICDAMAAAHQSGVIHGDLTPANILIAHDGRVVVTDFGFATQSYSKTENDHADLNFISPGGTIGFAAPEQISTAFGNISPATDIYALGALAFYLLFGRGPHQKIEQSIVDTLDEENVVIKETQTTAEETRLAKVVNRALKKAVRDRPQSIAELLDGMRG